jgi:hypothetical protein
VFTPDTSRWQWKDEDQLEEAVSLGIYTKEEAKMIRKEGERVISLVRENQTPFCDDWEKWSPPSDRNFPKLPAAWNMGF